ncbi:alkylglycerol monooxygenase, partial [Caerostris extrusa]
IPLYGTELLLYTWIYNNWRICSLPWNSPWTWILCMVLTDFFFYWMHRAAHQISIIWLFHEPHHSSEEFNLTVPLRLSIVTTSTLWLTYVPIGFLIPPSVFLVHYQLNVIFQYWLHSEYIPRLGILEYVFVTPSHHRVHHGRNRRCIDKNFGSIFILWDRLFGTFEDEGNQKIHFGVTKPLQTFNPITIQFIRQFDKSSSNYFQTLWDSEWLLEQKRVSSSKGPGWSPGTPWVGHLEDIPEPKMDEKKYDPKIPGWLELYVLFHASALVIGYLQMILFLSKIPTWITFTSSLYMILTTISIGCLLDFSSWGPLLELMRCPLYFLVEMAIQKEFSNEYTVLYTSMYAFRSLFFASFMLWIFAVPVFNKRKQL